MRNNKPFANPITILFLTLPYGISSGFVSVTLPYFLVQHGFAVASAAAITAIGVSANIWRFGWTPLIDLTLSLHTWYKIGIGMSAISLFLLIFIPFAVQYSGVLMVVVLLSQVAVTFVISPVNGFMAHAIEASQKGRAGGYFQAGNLGGMGLGGGAGVWLASHISYQASCIIISSCMLLCALTLYYVPQVYADKSQNLKQAFQSMLVGVKDMFRSRLALYTAILVVTPLGNGGIVYLWSSVAHDWNVKTDTVALVTGGLSGLASTIGCIWGGWLADKVGIWWAYFGAGTLLALITLVMYFSPFSTFMYINGVLWYALMNGLIYAAFSALLLHAVGTHLAATKYALLSALSNLAIVYMIAIDGWLHDTYRVKTMLLGETFLQIGSVVVMLLALYLFRIEYKAKSN